MVLQELVELVVLQELVVHLEVLVQVVPQVVQGLQV